MDQDRQKFREFKKRMNIMSKIKLRLKKIFSFNLQKQKRVEFSEEERKVLAAIGYYFGDDTNMLGITSIEVKNNDIYLTLNRPGIFIGKKGKNIDEVKREINNRLNREMKFHLIETHIDLILNAHKVAHQKYNELM